MKYAKMITAVCCTLILAAGIYFAVQEGANIVADRPFQVSWNGTIDGGEAFDKGPQLTGFYDLYLYLELEPDEEMLHRAELEIRQAQFPTTTQAGSEDTVTQGVETTQSLSSADGLAEKWMLEELEKNITSGKWPGFPYVKIGKDYYFNKTAVDNWFAEQGEKQLVIE